MPLPTILAFTNENALNSPGVPFEVAARIPTPWPYDLGIGIIGGAIVCASFVRRNRRAPAPTRGGLAAEAAAQTKAYFSRRLRRFDLPLRPAGTPFAVAVWDCVAALAVGEFVSYADVARAIGHPLAHRGVAAAMARTPIDLFIPAHRVVGADGRIKGALPGSLRLRLVAFERKGQSERGRKKHAP